MCPRGSRVPATGPGGCLPGAGRRAGCLVRVGEGRGAGVMAQPIGADGAADASHLRVGTFVHGRGPSADGLERPVFGAAVAAETFGQALARHTNAQIEAVLVDLPAERPPAPLGHGPQVRYHSLDDFLRARAWQHVDAWFDVSSGGV